LCPVTSGQVDILKTLTEVEVI